MQKEEKTRTISDDWSYRSFSRSDSIDSTSSTVYSYMQPLKPSPRSLSGSQYGGGGGGGGGGGIAYDESMNIPIIHNESFSSLESINTNSSTVIVSPLPSKQRPVSAKFRKRREREIDMGETRIPTPVEPYFPRTPSNCDFTAQEKHKPESDMEEDYTSKYSCKLPDISHKNH